MRRLRAIVRESIAAARSQPVASIVSMVIVAGMVASVLLTTGRTVGSEQAVLGSIDSAGTRSIVVRAESSAGLGSTVLDRLENIDGISWAGAFGTAHDVTNVAVPGGTKVPARHFWSADPSPLGVPSEIPVENETAWASPTALQDLGLVAAAGGVETADGVNYAVGGTAAVPDYLAFLEPVVVVPQSDRDGDEPVAVLVVVAARPDLVAPVAALVTSVLGLTDPSKATVTTSERLATLRALVQGQLGSYGRSLILVIFGLSALLVAAILYGLVMLRRKDFGRRRALGASQGLIVTLLLVQMTLLSLVGAVIGTLASSIGLLASGDPLPGIAFTLAIGVLAVTVAVVAALVPALAASRRDPLTELRVP